jgi:hypothetical protein
MSGRSFALSGRALCARLARGTDLALRVRGGIMKRSLAATVILALALLSITPAPLSAASADRIYEIASILQGRFEGATPGNKLTLNMSTITIDPSHPFDVFVQVSGKFENDNIRQQGVIRLESQGEDIYFTYIPHFDPAVTVLSNNVGLFTERELTSACSFTMKPLGDGFSGETLGITACALAMRGAIGRWSVELEPGSIRLRSVQTGETLRFTQAAKKK